MKRLVLAAAAVAAVIAPTAALADGPRRGDYYGYDRGYYDDGYYGERYYGDRYEDRRYERGYGREWRRGDYLPARLRGEWVNWRRHGLRPPADRNNAWFRVGDQFVMANIDNGLVAMTVWRR